MTIRQKLFAANSVLKADDVNNFLRDITVVDLVSELATLDSGIMAAFCLQDRRLYTRTLGTGFERYLAGSVTNNLIGTPNASSAMRMHFNTTVVQVSNTAGGCNVPYGTSYANGLATVILAPGDTTGGIATILPIGGQYNLTAVGCVAYQSGSQGPVPNGTAVRINVISVGW